MKRTLVAVAALALLAGCGGDSPTDGLPAAASAADIRFVESLDELGVVVNQVGTVPATEAGQAVCTALRAGDPVAMVRLVITEAGFSEDTARDFMTASVYAYCPDVV